MVKLDKTTIENKKEYYIDLLFTEVIKQFNENIKGKTIEHLKHYLREVYMPWFFWNYASEITRQEKEMVYVDRVKKNIDFYDFIGDEFVYFLNKKAGSKKRHGGWDYLKIWEFLNNELQTKNNEDMKMIREPQKVEVEKPITIVSEEIYDQNSSFYETEQDVINPGIEIDTNYNIEKGKYWLKLFNDNYDKIKNSISINNLLTANTMKNKSWDLVPMTGTLKLNFVDVNKNSYGIIDLARNLEISDYTPSYKHILNEIVNFLIKLSNETKQKNENIITDFDSEILNKYPKLTPKKVKEIYKYVTENIDTPLTEERKYIFEQYEGLGSQTETGIVDKGLLHQFYTPYIIALKMWELASHYGFDINKSNNVLEPSCGAGRFFKFAPLNSKVYAFEPDKVNIKIVNKLYPKVVLYPNEFETAFLEQPRLNKLLKKSWLPEMDLVIGNPPYGDYMGYYKTYMPNLYKRFEFLFIHLGLKTLKKGGLLIYIISQNFMNNGNEYNSMKKDILKDAEFVDAIRLPNSIFTNTDIGTDIIILRKK